MLAPAPPAPADRFALLIAGLCRAVAARSAGRALAGPLIVLIWGRLRRMAARFGRLAARLRAGKLSACPTSRRPAASGPQPAPLPRGFAWLIRLVPEAAAGAAQLQHLLDDPAMAALIAAAPQAGRILRPLCRMLGVPPPPGLRPAPPAPPAAPPSLVAPCEVPPAATPAAPPPRRRLPARPPAPFPRLRARSPPLFG